MSKAKGHKVAHEHKEEAPVVAELAKVEVKQEAEVVAKKTGKIAKVNMMLPSGIYMIAGQAVEMTAHDEEFLRMHHSPENLKLIME